MPRDLAMPMTPSATHFACRYPSALDGLLGVDAGGRDVVHGHGPVPGREPQDLLGARNVGGPQRLVRVEPVDAGARVVDDPAPQRRRLLDDEAEQQALPLRLVEGRQSVEDTARTGRLFGGRGHRPVPHPCQGAQHHGLAGMGGCRGQVHRQCDLRGVGGARHGVENRHAEVGGQQPHALARHAVQVRFGEVLGHSGGVGPQAPGHRDGGRPEGGRVLGQGVQEGVGGRVVGLPGSAQDARDGGVEHARGQVPDGWEDVGGGGAHGVGCEQHTVDRSLDAGALVGVPDPGLLLEFFRFRQQQPSCGRAGPGVVKASRNSPWLRYGVGLEALPAAAAAVLSGGVPACCP
ncbi:MAG TPA: hypothetical protein VIU15_47275 [Streptomyces sp.]